MQLALALSQSEAEESEKRRKKREGSSFYSSAAGKEGNETTKNSTIEQVSGVHKTATLRVLYITV